MEFVDDLLTFVEVGLCLKSHGCHVANLSSQDFSAKNGDWWLPQRFIKTVLNEMLLLSRQPIRPS